jgi:hypothetical protein
LNVATFEHERLEVPWVIVMVCVEVVRPEAMEQNVVTCEKRVPNVPSIEIALALLRDETKVRVLQPHARTVDLLLHDVSCRTDDATVSKQRLDEHRIHLDHVVLLGFSSGTGESVELSA